MYYICKYVNICNIFYKKSHEFPKMYRCEYINIHTYSATKIAMKNCKLVILIVKIIFVLKIIYIIDDSVE